MVDYNEDGTDKIVDPPKVDLQKMYVIPTEENDSFDPTDPGMVDIDNEQWKDLETKIGDTLNLVSADRDGFLAKIEDYEMAIHSVPEPGRTKPWDKSCELRDGLTGSHCRIIETGINRTLGVDKPYLANVKGDRLATSKLTGIANAIAKDIVFEKIVQEVSKEATRHCTAILIPEWERRIKREKDIRYYKSIKAYKFDFPNADTAGLSESEYTKQIKRVNKDIKNKGFHQCLYEYDSVLINKAVVYATSPNQFWMYPYTSPDIDLAQLLGHDVYYTFDVMKMMEADGKLKNVNDVAKNAGGQESASEDMQHNMKLEVKDLPDTHIPKTYRDKIYRIVKGIYRCDLNDEGIEKDYEYQIAYEPDSNIRILLRFAHYGILSKERNYIIGNILPEKGTIFGTAIPEMLENPQITLDTLIRLLIDSNSIANVPIFKAHKTDQEAIENSRDKGKIYPGRIFGIKQPQNFEAIKADRINAGDFINVMRYVTQQAELTTGASRTLAGQNLPDDPEAPGVKTAMLMHQSNFMVNEYIKNLRPTFAVLMRFLIKLYRQYMTLDEKKTITVSDDNGQEMTVDVNRDDFQFIDENTSFEVKNQRIEDSAASRQSSAVQDLQLLLSIPQIGQNPFAVRTLAMNYLLSRGSYTEETIEKIVPTMEQIKQMMGGIAKDVLESERAEQGQQGLQQDMEQQKEQNDAAMDEQIRQV